MQANPKVLAFVLPQFHRIPENDRWWGEGFTEWVNVRRAKALFPGHQQPRVPMDARYYDLRDEDTQVWQADLARRHGLHGFCYYHYWFNGRRLLEQPVQRMLERGRPDWPFCLAWANEPWTRAWDGGDREILMPQTYGHLAEWGSHFDALLPAFQDPRYIRVDGKPMFLIYRSSSITDAPGMIACWRQRAVQSGLPGLHLVQMQTGFASDPRPGLFDAVMDFEPMHTLHHHLTRWDRHVEKLARHRGKVVRWVTGHHPHAPNSFHYTRIWDKIVRRPLGRDHYPGAFVDWDNSPRRELKRATIFRGFSAKAFERGFASQVRKARQSGAEFLFVNAWNEWAEGAYLEPDESRKLLFLETMRRVLGA